MFLIRPSKPEDVSPLYKLARTVYFINLPPDSGIIAGKVEHSLSCFRRVFEGGRAGKSVPRAAAGGQGLAQRENASDMFMFSLEDTTTGAVIGTSQVRAHMGGIGDPNWRMKIALKKFSAPSIGYGSEHRVMRLDGDETGPTEMGGLILDPGFRGHALRPGRLLSFVRFHFVGLHRKLFAGTILAEMMGSVNEKGDSPFWDAFGRKFFPVSYPEADRFCQHNRAFISELFPKDDIFITLLPLEVQNLVGVVARETIPARRLLESIGFRFRGYIDPFDGGPHLDCASDDVPLVKNTRKAKLGKAALEKQCNDRAIVSAMDEERGFRALETAVKIATGGPVSLPAAAMELLDVQPGEKIGVTPLGPLGAIKQARQSIKARPARKKVQA